MYSSIPGNGILKNVKTNSKIIVENPNIIVLPILKNVDETIVGTIKRIAKGLKIPPVKNNRILNWIMSYIKKELEYESLSRVALRPNCKNIFVKKPTVITIWHSTTGKLRSKKKYTKLIEKSWPKIAIHLKKTNVFLSKFRFSSNLKIVAKSMSFKYLNWLHPMHYW